MQTERVRALPNLLTASRMLAAVGLLFCRPFSAAFFCVYLYAGISDCLDGFLARRLSAKSVLGAKLDSVADLLFTMAAVWKVVPAVPFAKWMYLWAAAIALLRVVTLCIGLCRYRALPFLHTYWNKATGALLFLFPVLYALLGLPVTMAILGVAGSVASLEELIITLCCSTLDRDVRGLPYIRR